MKILYFSEGYSTHDRLFLTGLADSRHEVLFLRLCSQGASLDARPLPFRVSLVESPFAWIGKSALGIAPAEAAEDLAEVLDRVAPDAIMAGPLPTCGAVIAHSGFHPWMAVSWGSDLLLDAVEDAEVRERCRVALGSADWLQCDCQAVRDAVRIFREFPDQRVVEFPWGIDPQQFNVGGEAHPLKDLPGWGDSFILLSTRSWEPIYDQPTLLRAFAEAVQRTPRLRLALLGDGSEAETVRHLVDELGIGARVAMPGRINYDRLPAYFRAADLYVTATISDGTSISLLEAMASGLPSLVTANAGNREWVQPGVNGWLAPARDIWRFASAMAEAAASDRVALKSMGLAARRVIESRADWSQNLPRLLEAFDQMEGVHA